MPRRISAAARDGHARRASLYRLRHDFVTCTSCRRPRKPGSVDPGGRLLCEPCSSGATHACPICQADVPGDGLAPCRPCQRLGTAERQVEKLAAALQQDWARDLFRNACARERLDGRAAHLKRRIARAATLVADLDRALPSADALTLDALLQVAGPDGCRRAPLVVSFLEVSGRLVWDLTTVEAFVANRRITAAIERAGTADARQTLDAFAATLENQSPRSRIAAVTSALSLLEASRWRPAAEITDRDVERVLKATPGLRAALTPFLAFLRSRAATLTPLRPRAKDRQRATRYDRKTQALIARLLNRLKAADDEREGRAVLAVLIAKLTGTPLSRVLRIRVVDIVMSSDCRWHCETQITPVPATLGAAWDRWAGKEILAFPGRMKQRSVSVCTVRAIIRQNGQSRSGRKSPAKRSK